MIHQVPLPPPTEAQGVFWCFAFAINGLVIGILSVPVVLSAYRGIISWVSAWRLGICITHLGWIPGRMFESWFIYHAPLREKWWVLAWAIIYTVFVTEIFRIAVLRYERRLGLLLDRRKNDA